MLKKVFAGVLLSSLVTPAIAGQAFTLYCETLDHSIIHMEHSKNGNEAEIAFNNGTFTTFTTDEGEYTTDLRTIYKASAMGKDSVKYTMEVSIYNDIPKSIVAFRKNDKIGGSHICQLINRSPF